MSTLQLLSIRLSTSYMYVGTCISTSLFSFVVGSVSVCVAFGFVISCTTY